MLSLHDLRAPAVALEWHEAVAVVAALTASMVDTHANGCPAPSGVTVLPSGELRVDGPTTLPGPPAAALGGVLGQLLETTPCPAELRQLADRYQADDRTGPAGQDALVAFMTALAFFERPGRSSVVAALAQRGERALDGIRRLQALEALTERTRLAAGGAPRPTVAEPLAVEAPAPSDWRPPVPDSPRSDSPWRLAAPAAAAVIVFVGMAFLAAWWFGDRTPRVDGRAAQVEEDLPIAGPGDAPDSGGASRPSSDPSRVAAGATRGAARTAGPPRADRASVGPAPMAPASGPPPAGPTPATAAARTPAAPPADANPASGTTAAGPPSKRGAVDVAISERDGRVVPSAIAPERQAGGPASGGGVFTAADAQVTPAVLIRPHLPEQPPPDVPEEQIGTLEFVVAESGAVEHVRLISPANRYQERMLVAAAKTWQFRPAMRDGRPVRYRIRIRLTL